MSDEGIEAPSWIGSSVLQGSTELRYNAFPFSICLTQDFRRSNAVHTLAWPAYTPPCTPSSNGDLTDCQSGSPDPFPDTMVQLCLVAQEVWDNIPQARITHLSPSMPRRCRVVHEAHSLSQQLLTLLHLTCCCTKKNATINFYLANDDSRQIADLTHTTQFLCVVFTIIKFPVEIEVRLFVCSGSVYVPPKYSSCFKTVKLITCHHFIVKPMLPHRQLNSCTTVLRMYNSCCHLNLNPWRDELYTCNLTYLYRVYLFTVPAHGSRRGWHPWTVDRLFCHIICRDRTIPLECNQYCLEMVQNAQQWCGEGKKSRSHWQ